MTTRRKILTLIIIICALGLLYPGVTQPILTLTGSIEKSKIAALGIDMIAGEDADSQSRQMLNMFSGLLGLDKVQGQLQAYSTTRSILGAVDELARTGNLLVGFYYFLAYCVFFIVAGSVLIAPARAVAVAPR